MKKTLLSLAITLISISVTAQNNVGGKQVYKDSNVVFHQIDDHTWVGNGNLCYMKVCILLKEKIKRF